MVQGSNSFFFLEAKSVSSLHDHTFPAPNSAVGAGPERVHTNPKSSETNCGRSSFAVVRNLLVLHGASFLRLTCFASVSISLARVQAKL